ncbi:hypothetical protein KFL_001550180 [Klebsormidium nitens]|uniref:Fucosyltransferase n=1 Tax=Klebsormidium nitens TaxID=105231 RepID=A0A1Y1I699_KLENI|nr:hypothetical protein KFL_001550180 [Klebsormidium nitens]|eukprot:GAQ83628.1 hypothetical protein KFL_001550180 [Klebsormidium nitens]
MTEAKRKRLCWAVCALFLLLASAAVCFQLIEDIQLAFSSQWSVVYLSLDNSWVRSVSGYKSAPGGAHALEYEERFRRWPGDKTWLADKCGNWQDEYTKLHNSIINGTSPPRYAVSLYVEKTGLADKLTGIITEFYYALLTRRAFQITHGNQPPFEAAYDAPFINWTRPNDFVEPNGPFWGLVNMDEDSVEIFRTQDLREFPEGTADAETVYIQSNRGRTHVLFDNPFHRQQLLDWGLRPDTAFACAYHYLFSLTDRISPEMKREISVLEGAKDALKIGIMVRVGDHVFKGDDDTPLETAAADLACVEQIEENRLRSGQQVLWYFLSESLTLRQKVKERYGDKVLTNTERVAKHPDCTLNGESCAQAERDSAAAGLVFGAAQVHALAMTDVQVFTRDSGFGRIGAWLSAVSHCHPLALYAIAQRQPRSCSIGSSDDLRASSLEWAGI